MIKSLTKKIFLIVILTLGAQLLIELLIRIMIGYGKDDTVSLPESIINAIAKEVLTVEFQLGYMGILLIASIVTFIRKRPTWGRLFLLCLGINLLYFFMHYSLMMD